MLVVFLCQILAPNFILRADFKLFSLFNVRYLNRNRYTTGLRQIYLCLIPGFLLYYEMALVLHRLQM